MAVNPFTGNRHAFLKSTASPGGTVKRFPEMYIILQEHYYCNTKVCRRAEWGKKRLQQKITNIEFGGTSMNVLLTSGARRIDFIGFFQQALKEAGSLGNIIVADPEYNAPSLQVADRPYVIPHQNSEEYIEAIFHICEENEIDFIISLNDWEVPKLAANKDRFKEMGVTVFAPDEDVVRKVRDKGDYERLLGEFGVKAPRTYFSVEETKEGLRNGEVDFPLIVKPRNGSGSEAMEIVANEGQLASAYELAVEKLRETPMDDATHMDPEENIIVQEIIDGEKYSLDIVNDLNGNFVTAFARKQLAMRGGDVDRTITTHKKELLDLGEKIGKNLKHIGYINTDVFFDGKDYYVIDINPRYGGGYAFTHQAGANIPAAFIAMAAGEEVKEEWLEEEPDLELARYDIVTKIEEDKLNFVDKVKNK